MASVAEEHCRDMQHESELRITLVGCGESSTGIICSMHPHSTSNFLVTALLGDDRVEFRGRSSATLAISKRDQS